MTMCGIACNMNVVHMNHVHVEGAKRMSQAVTCEQDILEKARGLVLAEGLDALNMRRVAQACEVAVGTVYRYYPDKTALMIAVVGSVWREVFAPLMRREPWPDALALVDAMARCVRDGRARYPGFFSGHMLAVEDAQRGREAMAQAIGHMRGMLAAAIRADAPNLAAPLTPDMLADFVIDFFKMDLMNGTERIPLLKALLQGVLA